MRAFILFIIMSVFFSMQADASFPNICHATQQSLRAHYTIDTSQHLGEKRQQPFTLWRTSQTVALQHPLKSLTQQRTRTNNRRLTRIQFFDNQSQAMKFTNQSSRKISNENRKNKFKILSNNLISKLNLINTQGSACELLEYYQLEENGVIYQLSWLPNKNLVSRYRVSSASMSKEWVLQSVDYNFNTVSDFFSVRDQYINTDFADIGDNESDPVLSKLIHLGFAH